MAIAIQKLSLCYQESSEIVRHSVNNTLFAVSPRWQRIYLNKYIKKIFFIDFLYRFCHTVVVHLGT